MSQSIRISLVGMIGGLVLSGCCNSPITLTDPRTPPHNITYNTEADCLAAIAANNPCTLVNANIAQVLQNRTTQCANYCRTPTRWYNKSCNSSVSNQNPGTPICEPEALVEIPSYWSVMCTNISLDCKCD